MFREKLRDSSRAAEANMPKSTRKRRTREHVIADLGVNHVERQILRCGWTMQRFSPDYGLDLLMTTFDRRGEIENGDIRLQIKATDSIKMASGGDAVAVRLQWRDMIYWLNEPLPVILVVYDAKTDQAWWLHLQQALRAKQPGAQTKTPGTLTVHVPLANVLDAAVVRRFRRLRDAAMADTRG
jgi:hypothetical protein